MSPAALHDGLSRILLGSVARILAGDRGLGSGVEQNSLFRPCGDGTRGAPIDLRIPDDTMERVAGLALGSSVRGRRGRSAAEILGVVYESLLDRDLVFREGAWRLVPWTGRRKHAGAFYSPPDLVAPTVARTLAPWLGGETVGAGGEAGILALRVCDPAMGTGIFLVESLEQLARALGKGRSCSREALRAVASGCLYGVDRDPLAVDLARLALWLQVGDPGWRTDELDAHLRVGDSLVGAWGEAAAHYPLAAWLRPRGSPAFRAVRDQHARPQMASRIEDGDSAWRATGARGRSLRADTWCATWFWPEAELDRAPLPASWGDPSPATAEIVDALARTHRFLHWDLTFPEIFAGGGFHAIVGNPPWEIRKANSREFFSRVDPDYQSHGKQLALRMQERYFDEDPGLRDRWVAHRERHRDLSHFLRSLSRPHGDPVAGGPSSALDRRARRSADLHDRWRNQRGGDPSPDAPFRHQGTADINSYKLFLELAVALLRPDGRLGLLLPSGLYTDRGSADLRRLLLDRCRWEWLFSFDNRDGLFGIHRSYRFGPVIAAKGGRTRALRAAFQRLDPRDWRRPDPPSLRYSRELVARLSPRTDALLELRDPRDLAVLERWGDRVCALGSPPGPEVEYATGFHMTRDSGRFLGREEAESRGFRQDVYGHWLRGPWRRVRTEGEALAEGLVPAADGGAGLRLDRIEEVAVPLAQGVMIGPLCSHAAVHREGAGHRARWAPAARPDAALQPQFLIRSDDLHVRVPRVRGLRTAFRALSNPTNERTVVATLLEDQPCGNSLGLLTVGDGAFASQAWAAAVMASFAFDWAMRQRLAGTNLNAHFLWESSWPLVRPELARRVALIVARLTHPGRRHAARWIRLREIEPELGTRPLSRLFALTRSERVRLRCVLDAVVADVLGMDSADLAWILRDCAHPGARLSEASFRRGLDPKGFWRVDRRLPPAQRQTTLTLLAFRELRRVGTGPFLDGPDGDGWPLPAEAQSDGSDPPGDRLAADPREQWARCAVDARRIDRIRDLAGLERIG